MKLLDNKVAIVTGGARGIGEGIVRLFAAQGAHVAFTYVSEGSAERAVSLAASLQETGVKVKAYQSNASDAQACEALVAEVMKEFGTIDICVNNAGISKDNLLMRMTNEQWEEVMQVNLNSVFYMTKQVIRPMMKARSGSIINMSSVIGEMGNAGQSSYAASKAGIIGFTKSIAKELGSRNIRCNAIAPGFIETEMTEVLDQKVVEEWRNAIPLKRGGQPKDVADLTVFLGSDMSAYITGQTINVCGGMLM